MYAFASLSAAHTTTIYTYNSLLFANTHTHTHAIPLTIFSSARTNKCNRWKLCVRSKWNVFICRRWALWEKSTNTLVNSIWHLIYLCHISLFMHIGVFFLLYTILVCLSVNFTQSLDTLRCIWICNCVRCLITLKASDLSIVQKGKNLSPYW